MIFKRQDVIQKLGNHVVELGLFFGDEVEFDSAVFDSRECFSDTIFVAIDGSKSTGIKFLPEAIENGATCVIANHKYRDEILEMPWFAQAKVDFIFVDDSLVSFGLLGELSREQFDGDVIGVIGSVGKTSTKNILRELGGGSEKTHASRGSFNNETGVPLTLCTLPKERERAIVEMGESHFGDLEYVASMSSPTILVVTSVELAHVEFLVDLHGVARTMNEAVRLMDKDSTIILPNKINNIEVVLEGAVARVIKLYDDREEIEAESPDIAKLIEIRSREDLTHDIKLKFENIEVSAHVPLIGKHFVTNAALAICASIISGIEPDTISRYIENVEPQGSRMREIETGYLTVIDDCYNANPSSMKASMKAIKDMSGVRNCRSVFIMGPMRELGSSSDKLHQRMGEYAQEIGIDILVCVDEATKSVIDSKAHNNSYFFEDVEKACRSMASIIQKGDLVGVKASRGPDPHEPAMMPVVRALEELK